VDKIIQIEVVVDKDGNTVLHGLGNSGTVWVYDGTQWTKLVESPRP